VVRGNGEARDDASPSVVVQYRLDAAGSVERPDRATCEPMPAPVVGYELAAVGSNTSAITVPFAAIRSSGAVVRCPTK
jgi:hypothetical protein